MNGSTTRNRVVVVGASLAGLRAAETLCQADEPSTVTVIGAETHRPYDRPPLSKKLLSGEWTAERVQLRQPDAFEQLDVDWRLGTRAVGLDLDDGNGATVHLSDGASLEADGVVIATGARPRTLPGQERWGHVHVLRTLDDSLALGAALSPGGRSVVVIGAGFIGLEAAATARTLGNDVVVLEGAPAPLIRALGGELGHAIAALHEDHGVQVRCNAHIESLDATGVVLAGGDHIPADVIVVGIGVEPVTDWLHDSGAAIDDGVLCDQHLQVRRTDGTMAAGVFAAGDVVRWPNALFDEEMRVEHWTNAAEQGALAAKNVMAALAGDELEPYAPLPFFWSDQYEHRIQFLGRASADDRVEVVAGSIADRKFLALFAREGRLHGALGVNAPRWVMPMRRLFLDGADWDDALAAAAELSA